MKVFLWSVVALVTCLAAAPAVQAAPFPAAVEGDFVVRDFRFGTGETLPSLNLHYRTIGTPQRDASGVVRNAVMILHVPVAAAFLSQTSAVNFRRRSGPGRDALLNHPARRHRPGKSSKPSDGLHARSRNTPTTTWSARSTRAGRRPEGQPPAARARRRWAPCTAGVGRDISASSTAWCRS